MEHILSFRYNCNYSHPDFEIFMETTDVGICKLHFVEKSKGVETVSATSSKPELHPHLIELTKQLDAYFAGRLKQFSLPTDPIGTPFQKSVWETVLKIPYGKTISYSELSERLQQPLAIRAIANANARNPLLLLVPCHRVIGNDGSLTGYAGGLHIKKLLLELEGALTVSNQMALNL